MSQRDKEAGASSPPTASDDGENNSRAPLDITRRDFVGATLIGSGTALLTSVAPGAVGRAFAADQFPGQRIQSSLADLPSDWTGPGGEGDYAGKNGNTAEVVNASHREIREGKLDERIKNATAVDDMYDLIVVGAGISGLTAARTFVKQRPAAKVLVLDQHAILGGEAKLNEMEVDGHVIRAPQGSTLGGGNHLFDIFGIEDSLITYAKPQNTKMVIPNANWVNMQTMKNQAWYFEDKGMVLNPWDDEFKRTPFSPAVREGLLKALRFEHREDVPNRDKILDSMTYREFLIEIVGVNEDVVDEVLQVFDYPSASDGLFFGAWQSALQSYTSPAVGNYGNPEPRLNDHEPLTNPDYDNPSKSPWSYQSPGGNSHIARWYLKDVKPEAIAGERTMYDVEYGAINWDVLDRPDDNYRLRLSATVFSVIHNDRPDKSTHVIVTYAKDGKMFSVRGKRVVCAGQQHVNRRICYDISAEVRGAMKTFHHYPMLVVNVAMRNWRFLEKIGTPAVRWFGGDIGWWVSVNHHPILSGRETQPVDPDKPFMMTQWIPILAGQPGDTVEQAATNSRMKLFAMPFSQIEEEVVTQFTKMFAPYGFDAKRDIAGIIANRQGHAYAIIPPNMSYPSDGSRPPREVLKERFHRIAFSHSEIEGLQTHLGAQNLGARAAIQLLEVD